MNYYNEWDKHGAKWLSNLIAAKLIPAGEVDERDIREVQSEDLKGYTQCHFFAGIAGWSLALQLAGWADERKVWTGSCPCQPFSCAGKGSGDLGDQRHLWPAFHRLIAECGPPVIFGEQIAAADGRRWLSGVRTDLESVGYAVGAADLCAAGVGSPQIRQRLFWVADTISDGHTWAETRSTCSDKKRNVEAQEQDGHSIGHAVGSSLQSSWPAGPCCVAKIPRMADGVPGVMGRIRAYGNAISPQVAAEFVRAYMETRDMIS